MAVSTSSLALRSLKQEDCKFQASLNYIVKVCPAKPLKEEEEEEEEGEGEGKGKWEVRR